MKKILCYGDSNTFGFNPKDGSRFDENIRWTSLLGKALCDEYEIIEEGACDRCAVANNPSGFLYSAQRHFPKMIAKANDIDILIFSLGTNDLQFRYDLSFNKFEQGLEDLILLARKKAKRIIIVPPLKLSDNILNGYFKIQFDENSIHKSRKIDKTYKKLSKIYNLEYFDFNEFVSPSKIDGLHYDIEGHKIIAEKLAQHIRSKN